MADSYRIVRTDRVVTELPPVPRPQCVGGTADEWAEYWEARDLFYCGYLTVPDDGPKASDHISILPRKLTPEQRSSYNEFVNRRRGLLF